MCLVSFESWELILQFVSSGLTKLDETIGYCWCPIVMRWSLWLQQWSLYGCTIVMSYIEINKAVSQWLLTYNLCVSVTWPLTCAFHIPCTHTPEIIDMYRGVCDNVQKLCGNIYIYIYICILYRSSLIWSIYTYTMIVVQYWLSCTLSHSIRLFLRVRGSCVECHFLFCLVYQLCLALWQIA